jgi:hypothetical protein
MLDNGLWKQVLRQQTHLEESKSGPKIEAHFVETDETEKKTRSVTAMRAVWHL